MAYQGYLDPIQHDKLIGWVWDNERPTRHVTVQVILDGRRWETRAAFRYRSDLQRAGIGQGDHAFGIDLPAEVFDGNVHRIAVLIDGTEWQLQGSPVTFQSRYEGKVEGADARRVWGTARDAARPNHPVAVLVKLNGRYEAQAMTDGGRFEAAIPAFLNPRERLSIELAVAGRALLTGPVERVHQLDLLRSLRNLSGAGLVSGIAAEDRNNVASIASGVLSAPASSYLLRPAAKTPLNQLRTRNAQPVDIIMPVFAGEEQTLRAIDSVIRSLNECPSNLVVCYDNPANATLLARIRELQGQAKFELVENAANLGFTATVNRGMALHPERDVVLLNADAAVHGNWLDRLQRAVYSDAAIGTATPFSNNATICSYPRFAAVNELPKDVPLASVDALFAKANAQKCLEIPTAVGFCMYIRRDCLNDAGFFDAAEFGAGYGEENDFCQRAASLGWRHVLAADVFVEHEGSVSFGAAAAELSAKNYQKLIARWPLYDAEVRHFIEADPVRTFRRNVDLSRVAARAMPCVAIASNLLGGGTERHVRETFDALSARGDSPILLRYEDSRRVQIHLPESPDLVNLVFLLPEDRDALTAALAQLNVRRIHFHQVIGAPRELFQLVMDAAIPYDCTLHDYAWLCPQVNLIDGSRSYCGEPANIRDCEACLRRTGNHKDWQTFPMFAASVAELRAFSGDVLRRAASVRTPSADTASRFARYFPSARITAHPHDRILPSRRVAPRRPGEQARVVLIGSIGLSKGYDVLYACARHARQNELPLRFCVVGATLHDRELESLGNVEITGDYVEHTVDSLVASQNGHVSFFPNVWPETFSYTLTTAFQAGLWPVAFGLGAIAERIQSAKFGRLLDLGSVPESINRALLGAADGK